MIITEVNKRPAENQPALNIHDSNNQPKPTDASSLDLPSRNFNLTIVKTTFLLGRLKLQNPSQTRRESLPRLG